MIPLQSMAVENIIANRLPISKMKCCCLPFSCVLFLFFLEPILTLIVDNNVNPRMMGVVPPSHYLPMFGYHPAILGPPLIHLPPHLTDMETAVYPGPVEDPSKNDSKPGKKKPKRKPSGGNSNSNSNSNQSNGPSNQSKPRPSNQNPNRQNQPKPGRKGGKSNEVF